MSETHTDQPMARQDAMPKLVRLLRRKSGLTLREFHDHLLERRAGIVAANPAVRRYVQLHALEDDPLRQTLAQAADAPDRESYDAVELLWFATPGCVQYFAGTEYGAAGLADEQHVIDTEQSVSVWVDEQVVVEPEGVSAITLVECLPRLPSIDRQGFREHWLRHGYLGKQAHAAGLLKGYIQNHARDDAATGVSETGPADEQWDGVVTAYFDTVAMAKELFRSPLASEEAYEDEKLFIDHSKVRYLMARRHPIKDLVR